MNQKMIERQSSSANAKALLRFRWGTSPIILTAAVWTISLAVHKFASELGADYVYFNFMVSQEQLVDDSNVSSYVWLLIAFLSFVVGAVVAHRQPSHSLQGGVGAINVNRSKAVKSLLTTFSITFAVAVAWVGGAVIQFGGIANLASIAASDNSAAREALRSASFPGGRLISSGFIGLTVFAAVILAAGGLGRGFSSRKMCVVGVFGFSLVYLGVIPTLVGGRINFFIAIFGAFVAATYVSGRMLSLAQATVAIILMAVVWTAKEYFTLGHAINDVSAEEQGVQGILFYFYNDVQNVLNTIAKFDGNYTYGWYSLRFLFFFTFTDKTFLEFISEHLEHVKYYVSAGEVGLLGAPIVDFGMAGNVLLFGIGFLVQSCHERSRGSFAYMGIYGMICASLIISSHATYLTGQEVIYSIILIALMSKYSKASSSGLAGV
jgi:hypothetical protein